jgi:hypothetical protein
MYREGGTSIKRKKGSGRDQTINYRVLAQRFQRNPNASLRELAKDVCSPETARKWHKKWEGDHDGVE